MPKYGIREFKAKNAQGDVTRGRFATTIFSATQGCKVGTMLTTQNNVATLCCAKNRRFESSCVTSPLYVYVYDRNSRKKSFRGITDKVISLLLNVTLGKHK